MGVKFTDIVEVEKIGLKDLEGRSVAIDAYNTLYQFLSGIRQRDGTPLMDQNGNVTSHLSGILYRTSSIVEKGIKPIYVFDGKHSDFKTSTVEKRKEIRKESEKEWKKALEVAEVLNIEVNDDVNYREVLMHKNNHPLIHAISYIPLKRLHDEFKNDLIRADIPIGRILRKYNMESRREIKTIEVEKSNKKLEKIYGTSEDILTRTYTIIHKGEILMWIKEFFPITYFIEKDSIN